MLLLKRNPLRIVQVPDLLKGKTRLIKSNGSIKNLHRSIVFMSSICFFVLLGAIFLFISHQKRFWQLQIHSNIVGLMLLSLALTLQGNIIIKQDDILYAGKEALIFTKETGEKSLYIQYFLTHIVLHNMRWKVGRDSRKKGE